MPLTAAVHHAFWNNRMKLKICDVFITLKRYHECTAFSITINLLGYVLSNRRKLRFVRAGKDINIMLFSSYNSNTRSAFL